MSGGENASWPAPRNAARLSVNGLTHWFGLGDAGRQVLFDLELEINAGEIVFLMGPSGCGKSTLLTLVGALRSVQAGSVRVLGKELKGARESERMRIRRRIGFVFQNHKLHRALTATQNVRMALEANGLGLYPDATSRCHDMLRTVGLGDHLEKLPGALSGGQSQRVAIARAIVAEPELILADEPTAALDSRTGREVIMLLRSLARERGMSVLMVTHDNRILDLADRILEMEDGRIREAGSAIATPAAAPDASKLQRTPAASSLSATTM